MTQYSDITRQQGHNIPAKRSQSRLMTIKHFATILLLFAVGVGQAWAEPKVVKSWDFTQPLATDLKTALGTDTNGSTWKYTEGTSGNGKNYWSNAAAIDYAELTTDGTNKISITEGLLFNCSKADNIRIREIETSRLNLNGSNLPIRISDLKKGQKVVVVTKTGSSTEARGVVIVSNLTATTSIGFGTTSTSDITNEATVDADGYVEFKSTKGIYIKSITVYEASGEEKNAIAGATFTDNAYTYTGGSFVIDPKVTIPTLITYTDGTTKQNSATATVAINQANDTFVATATIGDVVYTVNIPASQINTTLSDVTETTTWDWTKTGLTEIQLTDATRIKKSSEFVLSNLITNTSDFNSDALKVIAEYPVRGGKYMQGNKVIFHTTVPGNIVVKFSNTGTRTAGQERYLVVNGTQTSFGSITANENDVTTDEIAVPAGNVVLTAKLNDDEASQMIRIYSIVFTATSTPDPDPTPELIPFSMADEATTAAAHYPTEWEAGHEVALPQLPEFTATNTFYIDAAAYGASTSSNDNTAAIQAALNVVPAEGGMVVVPEGEWLSGPLTIKSKTVLHLKAGATLKLLPYGNGNDGKTASAAGYYPTNGTNDKGNFNYKMFLTCVKNASTSDIVVEGEGETSIIDGQGAQWWDKRDVLGTRPPLIRFEQGQRFLVRNLKLQNAPGTNLTLGNSGNASHFTVHDVTISNPSSESDQLQQGEVVSHNTDGIPVWGPYVNIYNCNISTGDDNIVADSDAHHLHAWNINCGYGHGMSIGSYTERLHDVIYEDITFTNTTAGFRIKTNNDRSGNDQAGTNTNGAVKNIICRNATMTGVPGPIKITSWYDDDAQDPSTVATPSAITATTPEFCNITFQNITADAVEGKTQWKHNSPIYIYGRPELKIHDITFNNVKIASKRGMYLAYCEGVNFTNGCRITNETTSSEFISTQYEATVTGNYGQPKPVTWAAPATAPEAGATLVDNDELNVVTVYATTAETNYGHKYDDFSFDNTIQVRVNTAPTADNLTGTNKATCTPLVITAKKDGKFTVYYRRQTDNGTTDGTAYTAGNSKDILLVDQTAPTTKITGRLIGGSAANNDYVKQTYNLTADHVYTLYATGTTIRVNGFNYDTSSTATITYYDADGTTPVGEPQEMEAGSGLVIKYGESDVHVPSGTKFRNWRIGSATGEKAVEGMPVNEDLNLYAYVTDEEKADAHNTISFIGFDADEHDVITEVNNCTTDPTHGLGMADSNSEVIFTVAGKTSIKLKKCSSAATDAKFVIKKKSSAPASQRGVVRRATAGDVLSDDIPAYSATDGEEVTYEYTGDAADLIITTTAPAYLHSLELTPAAAQEPEPETETVTIFDAADEGWTADGVNLTTGTTTVGGVTWYGRGSAAISANNLTFSDDVAWTKYLKTGDSSTFKSGSDLAGVLTYTPTKAGKIRVYAKGGGDTDRYLYISQSITSTDKDVTTAVGTKVDGTSKADGIATADVEANKPVYIWATNSMLVYGITFESVVEPTHTWDFTNWSEATKTQVLGADDWTTAESATKNYITGNEIRWNNAVTVDTDGNLTAGGQVIKEMEGLQIMNLLQYGLGLAFDYQTTKDSNIWGPYNKPAYLWVMGTATSIVIPNVKCGTTLKVTSESHKPSEERGFNVKAGETALTSTSGTSISTELKEFTYTIPGTDGVVDVVLQATKGCHLYWIDAEQGEPVDPTPTVEFEPFKIDFRVKASETQLYTVTLPANGVLPECVTVNNVVRHGNQHGATNGTSLTVHVDGPTKFTIGGCNFGNTVSVKVGSADAVAVDNKTATCDNGGDAIAGLSYNNNVTYKYEGTEAADITFTLGSNAYMPYLFAEKIVKDWTPTWNPTAERWEVKKGETDAENAESLIAALDYLKSQTNKTLYIPNGTYDLGETALTAVPADFHLIGESQDGVLIKNQLPFESIKYTATLKITGANVILENMTIKCRATYGKEKKDEQGTIQASTAERGVCVMDEGNGSHYINVTLDGLQDTYYSNGDAGMKATFDNCIVRGNVDFFCGSGNITVNNSQLQIVTTHTSGGTAVICAPATYTTETQGYLFNNCIVEAATSEVGCLVSGHSNNLKFNLARAWYAGGSTTEGKDKTPRVTFKDTEFEIAQAADWGNSIGYAQAEERRIFQIINTGVQFSHEAQVIDKTNKPFAYATANDRTNPASVSPSNITGGGEYDLETIMELMGTEGIDYTVGTTKTINGHKAIVLQSDNTVDSETKKETRVPMDSKILNAIKDNDIIVLDGSGTSTDFVLHQYIRLSNVNSKTIVGINGARLCTEWYLTDYFKSILENVPTSSGTGVNSASTAEGTGGYLDIVDSKGEKIYIKEEGEYLTRKYLYEATGDEKEQYRNSGIFYIDHSSNIIIRNFKFVGPGSLDCAGYDLMAIIDDTHHCWVDHCEFIDGMDGNFDITNRSNFVTVSWCKFYYTDRSYAHQNTNLVGSGDDKTDDRQKLNITFAYNEWGTNCRARMPMARYGRIHMLNNYYNCAGNSEYAMNPRLESEFLIQGNYWEKGVRRAYNPKDATAITWDSSNYYADKVAANAGANQGTQPVTVPYQYSALILDPHKVPEVITLNGGAKLYQKPYFTTNLGVADNTSSTPELEYTTTLSECEEDGLVFSVWAENAHTFQWYKQDIALDGTVGEWAMIEGENRNSYTFKPQTGGSFNLKCKAFGVSGETESDVLKVTIDGESKPIYITDLDDTKTVEVISGSPQIFTVNAGTEGVTYQWYKSANADGSSATAITDATDRSYTYNPTATTGEVVYLFCRAHNAQGDTDSKIVKVKGIYRNVKFHMYATYDANASETSVYVDGATHNINNIGTKNASIISDTDECKAEANRTSDIPGLKFTAGSTDYNPLGIYAQFTPTTAIAEGDKIEISANTSNSGTGYGFYVCKAAELGTDNANVIGTVNADKGSALATGTVIAPADLTTLYLIPFVSATTKNVNLANVVVYSGDITKPVDAPAFTKDLEESYEVSQDGTLELEVDYDANDVSAVQWYKNTINSNTGGTLIPDATSKTYAVPTAELGITYYYAVITGKTPYNETKVASVSTKVTVKAKPTSFKTYTYDMTLIQGITTSEQAIDASKDIPSIEDPEGHIATYIPSSSGSSIRLLGQDYGDGFKAKGYVKIGGKSSTTNNYITVDVDNDDATITVYAKGGGDTERSIIVYKDKNNIPNKDNAILNVDGTSKAVNYGTTPTLNKGTYYIGALGGAGYVYGIVVTVPEDATAQKEIVHYKIANDASLTAGTKYEAELGNIVFGNVSITKITPAEGDPFSGNKLDGNPAASGTKYAKIIMPEGMPVKEGDIIKLSGFQEKSDNPSSVGFAIYPTRAEGMTKETALYFTKAKDILEEFEYKVPAGSNLIDKTEFFVFRDGANTVFFHEITISREMKAETECAKPAFRKGAWNDTGANVETWNYTISSSTPTAVIHYQVNGGKEVVATASPKNTVTLALKPGDKVKAWATDAQGKIDDSEVNELTVPEKAKLTKPTITVGGYSLANKAFPVTITAKAEEGANIYYTTDGTEPSETSTKYTAPFNHEGGVTIKAIAIKDHWTSSDIVEAIVPMFESDGSEKIVYENGSANNADNVGLSYFVLGNPFNAGGIAAGDGIKYRVNSDIDGTVTETPEVKGFRIKVNDGFVIKKIVAEKAYTNAKESDGKGQVTLTGAYVDVTDGNYTNAKSVVTSKVLPYSDKTAATFETSDNLNARKNVDFTFTISEPTKDDATKVNQAGILFKVYYELDDEIATSGEDIVTINGTPLTTEQLNTLKTTGTVEIPEPLYPEDPVILMKSKLGYTYTLENKAYDALTKYNSFQKTFLGHTYTVKVKVNDVKSPTIIINEDFSLAGGYKVTLGAYSPETTPYIRIDGGEWEEYDPSKTYYALKTVQSKVSYTEGGETKETEPRSATCPSNSYEAGKPFAVFIYVNGYSDNQVGVTAYNNESLAKDQIYQAIKRQFNVVDLPVNNSDAILDKRPDITDAKLVVITESLGGSGSVEIAGVGNKSNMMALTIKRDVLDKTNVLNLKMFLNGSSSANNQRWQWAQPRAMASELTSIVPLAPADGGMYEVFSTTTMSRDGSINLWDDVNTENLLYHLQPVFNFNEENETRPTFTPLALVIDPEEPEDQREEYHALHFYKKGDYQYAAFGLSLNEWPKYNDNVGAIVEKIGEMIIAGRDLDSPLEGIVKPVITDNGDGSAKVMNNNINAETFYKVYTETEYNALGDVAPTADDIIAANQQPDDEYCTPKYINDMHVYAVSRLGGALSEVVHGTIEGSTIRYVIRDNDDAAAVGLVAKYPFDLNVNSGTFNMPYNQSWKKDGYTVTSWVVTKSRDASHPVGSMLTPGQDVDGLTQDITVKAVWSENKHKITDISSSESDKAKRTVTWEFLQSKGAPALAMERTAGNMQAVLVGQVKFADGTWLDVPMTINTDHLATLPDNGTEYHGKFNNTSTNWAKELKDGETVLYTGTDYTQVRTGTQFTFPVIYGSNIVYKQVDLVEATNGKANGNVNRSQISQSYLTDGSKTGNDLNYWRIVNPGYELTPGFSGMYLQPNCTVVFGSDGKAQLATTSPLYAMYKTSMGAMGYDSQLYDADADGNETGGNANYGGLIYYDGEATEATMTSVESANYVHVGADTGKALGALNYGSVFMQSLSITYPVLHSLEYEVVPEMSALEGANEPAAVATVITDSHKNTGGKYLANENVEIIVAPSYGYYISKATSVKDQYTKAEADEENATHLRDDISGRHPGDQGYIPTYEIGYTPKKAGDEKDTDYIFLTQHKGNNLSVAVTDGITYDGDVDSEGIPSEGAKVRLRLDGGKLVFKLLKHPTYRYNAYAEPGLYGNVYFNTNTDRTSEQEYNEFAAGKHIIMSATPKTGYRFVRWENKKGEEFIPNSEYNAKEEANRTGFTPFATNIVKGDGSDSHKNPFTPSRNLAAHELDIIVDAANALPTVPEYIAIFEKANEGTAYYLFNNALLQTDTKDAGGNVTATAYSHLDISDAERRAFPNDATSTALNVPSFYTIFKEGYTLDHWVEKDAEPAFDSDGVLTNAASALGTLYEIGNYYYYENPNDKHNLIPVFKKNEESYDYRATEMDITWDFRSSHYAQRVNLPTSDMNSGEVTYYSTHATFNDDITVDVPLQISFEGGGRFVNNVIDDWAAFGEGTKITIPSGVGAKFTLATYAPLNAEPGMGGTNFDGVVPTEYTVREENGMPVYYYTYVTPSTETTVTLTIGSDYTYYKYLRAQLPSADAVTLYLVSATPEFGDVKLLNVTSTKNEDITADATKVKRVEGLTFNGEPCQAYTLPLGSHVKVQADRKHYYVIDHIDDLHGEEYPAANVHAPTSADKAITGASADDSNLVLDFDIMAYENAVVTYYKLNTLYQVNYTSGQEAEGEAPGMMLIESGESFTIPAVNHHLYVDGQTLRYWVDEDGNKYDLGQTYTLGQTFTASKDLPSGITSGSGFTVPEKDLFLSPYFAVNDFTVMNLDNAATASWPLSRLGSTGTPSYEGNGDIVINYEGINGIYVTQLQVKDGGGNVIDFIDLKMDIRGENGKANNVNSTDRCQINTGTVFGMPSSSNCSFTLKSANNDITVKVDGGTDITGKPTVTSNYTGDKTQVDISFTGNTYLYEVVAQYNPVTTELPELDYATVGNISLGAIGTPLASYKLSTLKTNGMITGVPADLSGSTTGIMPVVRGTATRGGYVEVTQATIDNPVATMLVKTRDGVTVSVYKIGFNITYPNIAPRVTDLKVDRKFQCDLQAMYANATTDLRVDGTNYINDPAYLKHLGVDGDNAANERVGINGVINIKFSTKMAETVLPASTFQANGTGKALGQAISSLEGQTLTFTYKGLDVDTEYDFIIPAGTFKDVFWEDAADDKKAIHVYNEPIRIHFTTVETAISIDHRVVNFVVTHNQASHFDAAQAKMVKDGEKVQIASDELIANLVAKDIPHGTIDEGVALANAYTEAGKRFYIFVPDGEYQLMGNEAIKSISSDPIGEDGKTLTLGTKTNVYNGITAISHDNVSITGQSQEKTIVYNHPAFEGLSYASTLKLNNGIANFYAQDLTLQNRFDFLRCRKVSSKGVAPTLWDRSQKAIFKNVKFDSYQDTYYTNANNQLDDTRGYAEDCTIMGYVDFICGDGDHWFQNCDMVVRQGVGSTATNMFAPGQYDTQQWGFVMNQCTFSAENSSAYDVNNGKMTIARPWKNSPAEALIECTYNVLSTDDGYKKMTGDHLVLRMHEYMSKAADGTPLDLSKRSLRNSSPGIGSYDAVMTPSKAKEYNLFDVMGGEDGYDPTLYTAQAAAPKASQDDQNLKWDAVDNALCYFVFIGENEADSLNSRLIDVVSPTDALEWNIYAQKYRGKYFFVRAANQRGGLGPYSNGVTYVDLGEYDLKMGSIKYSYGTDQDTMAGYSWSTICLPFGAAVPKGSLDDPAHPENINTANKIYVYAVTEVNGTAVHLKKVEHLDAYVGYVVYSVENKNYRFFGSTYPSEADSKLNGYAPDYVANKAGILEPSTVELNRITANVNCYTLAYKDQYGIGFYKFTGEKLKPYRAWLDASDVPASVNDAAAQGNAAKGSLHFVFDDDDDNPFEADAIRGVYDDSERDPLLGIDLNDPDTRIYDLQGQRIRPELMRRGMVYIINGVKVQWR